MIKGIPLQTDSKGPHTRLWGCFVSTIYAAIMDYDKQLMTADQVLTCIRMSANSRPPSILDNDIPVGQDGWYRVYGKNPPGIVRDATGGRLVWKEVLRTVPGALPPTTPYNYIQVEYATESHDPNGELKFDKDGKPIFGSHFVLADYAQGTFKTSYNPWPGLKLLHIKTVRYINLTTKGAPF